MLCFPAPSCFKNCGLGRAAGVVVLLSALCSRAPHALYRCEAGAGGAGRMSLCQFLRTTALCTYPSRWVDPITIHTCIAGPITDLGVSLNCGRIYLKLETLDVRWVSLTERCNRILKRSMLRRFFVPRVFFSWFVSFLQRRTAPLAHVRVATHARLFQVRWRYFVASSTVY